VRENLSHNVYRSEKAEVNVRVKLTYHPRPGDELSEEDVDSLFRGILDVFNGKVIELNEVSSTRKEKKFPSS